MARPMRAVAVMHDRLTGEEAAAPRGLVDLAKRGWEIKVEMDRLEQELRAIQDRLLAQMHVGESIVIPGVCRVTRSLRQRVDIADAEQLMALLGSRFEHLVETKVRYRPTGRLVAMGTDGDHPLQREIAACMEVQETPVLSWRAEK